MRPVRLKGPDMAMLRRRCFDRDGWRCTVCNERVSWTSGHMAHIVSRGRGGPDTLENVKTKCATHHLVEEHNPKSVRSKA